MEFDLRNASSDFKTFYEAFSPETYGVSTGRAAEHVAIDFDRLPAHKRQMISDWFFELFAQQKEYYGMPYLRVVEKIDDSRFLPYIKIYLKKLRSKHHKKAKSILKGKCIESRSDFTSEIRACKKLIRKLKN